jgi:hypothetical protein
MYNEQIKMIERSAKLIFSEERREKYISRMSNSKH